MMHPGRGTRVRAVLLSVFRQSQRRRSRALAPASMRCCCCRRRRRAAAVLFCRRLPSSPDSSHPITFPLSRTKQTNSRRRGR